MVERLKKAVDLGKSLAVVVVFLATIGSALYAAWFKPSDTKKVEAQTDAVYDTLRARIDVNEQFFLTTVQQIATLRADLGQARNELAALKARRVAASTPAQAPPVQPTASATEIEAVLEKIKARHALPVRPEMQQLKQ